MPDKIYGDKDRAREQDSLAVLQDLLTEQTRNINAMTEAIGELATALDQRPTKKQSFRVLMAAVLIVIIFLGGTFYTSQQNNNVIHRIDDCVNVEGECYKRNQERTAKAVEELVCKNEITVQRALAITGAQFELSEGCEKYLP